MVNEKSLNSLMCLNYWKTMAKADQMKALAFLLGYQIQKLNYEKAKLSRYWQSPSEQVFMHKIDELIGRMYQTQRKMRQTADTISTIAASIKRAEDNVENNAKKL